MTRPAPYHRIKHALQTEILGIGYVHVLVHQTTNSNDDTVCKQGYFRGVRIFCTAVYRLRAEK